MWNNNEKIISLKTVVLFFVFLATLNTLNLYYFFIFIAFGVLMLCTDGKMVLNSSVFALLLLAASLVLFSPVHSNSLFSALKTFSYLMCYIIGYNLYGYKSFDTNKSLKPFYTICIFVVSGSFLHYFLNWMTNLTYSSRNTVDFWTKEVLGATGQAPLACLASAFSIACLFSKTSIKAKIISSLVLIIAIAYNFILSGRTLFMLLLITLVVAFMYKLMQEKRRRLKSIIAAILVLTAILAVFSFNLFGIRTKIESTPFYERFFTEDSTMELDEDSRMDHKLDYIKYGSNYLFGGAHLREQHGWAHDIFLDTYDEAGIFALLAIVVYILATIGRMFKCIKNKHLPFEFRQAVLCMYVVLYVQFMVEPILQGEPWLFASLCVIDGNVTRLINDYNKVTLYETKSTVRIADHQL